MALLSSLAWRFAKDTSPSSRVLAAAATVALLAGAATADGTMIVGTSTSSAGDRATLWTPTLGLVDLNNYLPSLGADLSGWSLSTAYGISLDGSVITGVGQFNGQTRAFVVTNVPAAGTSVVLAMGWPLATRRRRAALGG